MAGLPLLYNPASGHGRGERRARDVQARLAVGGLACDLVPTKAPGHATTLAAELAPRHDRLLVVGGDGTISEAARGVLGLAKPERPELACFPAGTGNDFLRDHGIHGVEAAVQACLHGAAAATDAVEVAWDGDGGGRTWSINIAGTGLLATAAVRANEDWKWLGRKGYDVAAALEILRNRPCPTRLVLDGRDATGDYPLVAACTSSHTGGGMRLAPGARTDDGLLDVVTATGLGPMRLLGLLATKVRAGRHVGEPGVQVRQAARVEVAPETATALNVDGETLGRTPATFTVHRHALRVLRPPAGVPRA